MIRLVVRLNPPNLSGIDNLTLCISLAPAPNAGCPKKIWIINYGLAFRALRLAIIESGTLQVLTVKH